MEVSLMGSARDISCIMLSGAVLEWLLEILLKLVGGVLCTAIVKALIGYLTHNKKKDVMENIEDYSIVSLVRA